jgi:uncharacterized membrane protein YhaH (DUF805 family)
MNIKRYFSFKGNINRTEYWAIYLASCLAMMLSLSIAGFFVLIDEYVISYIILCVTCISIIWTSVAALIKRCRDIGISPLFSFGMLIPTVNIIVLIVLGCLPSKMESYGPTSNF